MLWTEHGFDPHVACSRALPGPELHVLGVKFGNGPLQPLGRASLC